MSKFGTFSGIRPPRLSGRSVARAVTAKAIRRAGGSYSTGRAGSLLVWPWKRAKK